MEVENFNAQANHRNESDTFLVPKKNSDQMESKFLSRMQFELNRENDIFQNYSNLEIVKGKQ